VTKEAYKQLDSKRALLKNSIAANKGDNIPLKEDLPEKPIPNNEKMANYAYKEKRFFERFRDRIRASIGGR
jgi:hypothetical protein